jgi:hypothetical protein
MYALHWYSGTVLPAVAGKQRGRLHWLAMAVLSRTTAPTVANSSHRLHLTGRRSNGSCLQTPPIGVCSSVSARGERSSDAEKTGVLHSHMWWDVHNRTIVKHGAINLPSRRVG